MTDAAHIPQHAAGLFSRSGSRVRWVMSRGIVEYDELGDPALFTGVLVDITERKRAEEALRRPTGRKTRASRNRGTNCAIRWPHPECSFDIAIACKAITRSGRAVGEGHDDPASASFAPAWWTICWIFPAFDATVCACAGSPTELQEIVRGAIEMSRPAIDQKGHELRVAMPTEPLADR